MIKTTIGAMRSLRILFRKDQLDFLATVDNLGAFVRQAVDAAISYRQDDEYRKTLQAKNTGVTVCPGCNRTIHVEQEGTDGYIFSCPFCDRVLNISQTGAPDSAMEKE